MIRRFARWVLRDDLQQANTERQQLLMAASLSNAAINSASRTNAALQHGLGQAHDTIERLYSSAYPTMPEAVLRKWREELGPPIPTEGEKHV